MRIAIDARWNYHGGVGVYVSNLLDVLPEAAQSRGISVVAYDALDRPIVNSHPNLTKIRLRHGCYSPLAQVELAVRAKRDKIDVLHTPFYVTAFLVGCPTVITIHDLIPFMFPVYGFLHGEAVKMGYRLSARCASHIATDSDATRRDVLRLLRVREDKVTTLHCGVSQDVFSPTRGEDELEYLAGHYGIKKPYVLVMSASNWKTKNLEGSLRAIERARDLCDLSFQTVVVGSEIGINQTGLRDRLRDALVTGPIPAPDLPKFYRNASAFITLSRYEGFGYPLAEAMSCGTPCIASDGGSLAEIAGKGAIVVADGDEVEVARALIGMLSDSERRRKQSEAALDQAVAYSMSTFAESALDLYQKVYNRQLAIVSQASGRSLRR